MKRIVLALLVAACGHTSATTHDAAGNGEDFSDAHPPPMDATTYRFQCDRPPPNGAQTPTPPPLAMACPTLVAGINTITSSTKTRTFHFVVPANLQPTEKLPVLFMWYWLGGSADGFIQKGEVQQAADAQRFLAIVPESEGATIFGTNWNLRWPFDITQTQARMDEEFQFFDDMLSCAEQQFNVNQNCVSTVGVSAGALFTDQLAQARSERLASFISLSGGVGDNIIKPWSGSTHKLPALVLYGGDGPPAMDGVKDILGCLGIGMDFSVASNTLMDNLTSEGHFFVECKHNCGHVEPPITAPPGQSAYAGIWEFAFNHPFWLAPGDSPYKNGLPATMPPWCGIGHHGATPRSGGGCPPAQNPCPS
jgi:predicted esterase